MAFVRVSEWELQGSVGWGVKPWPCSSNPLVKLWLPLLVFLLFSNFLRQVIHWFPSLSFHTNPTGSQAISPPSWTLSLSYHAYNYISCIPFICPIPVLNLADVVPDFLPLFFFTLCFQLIFLTSSLPFLLPLCPHHCSSLWLWAAAIISFSINRAETRSAALHPDIISRMSPFSPRLRWQTLPFVYSPTARAVPPPELIPVSFASNEISQEVLGSASGAVSVWIDACSSRHTPCCNNHRHLVLSWGEMCLLQLELSFRWSWETMH